MATKFKYNITEVCMTFLHRNRFYATILAKLVKIPTKMIPTAGVGFNKIGKLCLYYNEEFLLNLPLEKAQAILEHEVLHVFFRHLTRHPKDGDEYLDNIKNIGCDIAINQYIPQMPNKQDCLDNFKAQLAREDIPEVLREAIHKQMEKNIVGSHTPEMYGFDKEQAADYYIEELKKKFPRTTCPTCGKQKQQQQQGGQQQQQQGQGGGQGNQQQDQQQQGQGGQGQSQGQQQQQQGQGEGEGEGQDGQQQQGQGQGGGQQQSQGQGQGGGKGRCPTCGQEHDGKGKGKGQGLGGVVDDHSLWDKVLDEANGEIISVDDLDIDPEYETVSIVQKCIKECKDYGSLPNFVRREIEELQKPIVRHNWKHELKVFVNSVLSVAKRLSQKRVNRRFIGKVDYILPGKKKSRRPNILLARDTSGSVFDDETQNEFLNEMINISKFANVFVADCDTLIHQVYQVRRKEDFRDHSYKGGGGTAFEPVFKKAKELNVDGIIYLTDTYGSFPDKNDIGKLAAKTIWVTVGQEKVELPFGKHVNIEKK